MSHGAFTSYSKPGNNLSGEAPIRPISLQPPRRGSEGDESVVRITGTPTTGSTRVSPNAFAKDVSCQTESDSPICFKGILASPIDRSNTAPSFSGTKGVQESPSLKDSSVSDGAISRGPPPTFRGVKTEWIDESLSTLRQTIKPVDSKKLLVDQTGRTSDYRDWNVLPADSHPSGSNLKEVYCLDCGEYVYYVSNDKHPSV